MTKLNCLIVFCLLLAGCHAQRPADGVRVVIDGADGFPAALAGRWIADRHGWEIVLDAEGRIASAVVGLGQVEITPGVEATVPTQGGGESTFEPGLWTVHYEGATQHLTAQIVLDHVRVEMGGNVLEGKSRDVFSGSISAADGVWQVQWTAFTAYEVHTEEGEDVVLSTDPTYGETQPLTFEKAPSQ